MAYDFTTLSPDEFENLAADLLSLEWETRLESFKPGKDGGIDLRNTRILPGQRITVVQCKRYAPQNFAELCKSIKAEKKKLDRIRPERYVLVTSVGLSPQNKQTLLDELVPWCSSPADIYGPAELNGLLRAHPEVERIHFKLWLSSTPVLERILHARIFNVTQATIDSTKAQLCRLVMHGGFDRALQILRDEHHVLIVGNPGIGKTTLARMLMCHYLQEDFEPVCVLGDIGEAWDVIQGSFAAKRKVVVLYDDFLGRFRFDSQRFGKNEEHSLFEFLDKVRRAPNLRFILTTREYILADARRIHGAFDARAEEIIKCTLSLDDYSTAHRAKILFNHLYFSDLPRSRLKSLVRSRAYEHIVFHTHFNPRIVESISKYANSKALTDRDYVRSIKQEFDDPSKLWEHPFRNDISPVARITLAILWTFGGMADLDVLKAAVTQALAYEGCSEAVLQFTEALRQLDGNFLLTNRYPRLSAKEDPVQVVQFQNPSVEEFIDSVVSSDNHWVEQLAGFAVTFRQVHHLVSHTSKPKTRGRFPVTFWLRLRRAAATAKFRDERIINYRRTGEGVEEMWETDSYFTSVRKTLTQFRIETHIRKRDTHFKSLQMKVLTRTGWSDLIGKFPNNDDIARTAAELFKWITANSGWAAEEQSKARTAFKDAAMDIVSDGGQIWMSGMAALRILAETFSADGGPFSTAEKRRFGAAAKMVVRTIEDNAEDADNIHGEADELEALGVLCDIDVKSQVVSLRSCANSLAERQNERGGSDPEGRSYSSTSQEEAVDLDSLFAGLLD